MAFGGRHRGRAVRVLWLLIANLCLIATPAAFAQQGNGLAGRVPVLGVPEKLQDDLKQIMREEPAPTTLFEARRQWPAAGASFTGLLTTLYGIGQIAGPPLVAWLLTQAATPAQGFNWALGLAAIGLVLGAGLYGVMRWRWQA